MGGKTVQKDGPALGGRHKRAIHAETLKSLSTNVTF